jgi:3'(2'), 5'-bisphosphate nucleotidase
MNQSEILDLMKKLAVEAGSIIMDIYNTDFTVDYKEDESPLTMADQKANQHIVSGLAANYPDYAILSEEIKDDKKRMSNRHCFIVDPLDGTKEFVKRNGQFTVNIALVCESHPVLGVIYVPVSGDLYYASTEEGAFKQNGSNRNICRLHVSDKTEGLVSVGSKSHASEKEAALIKAHRDVISKTISAGSSLKGCMVAEAQADIYYRFGLTCEWDTAAMQCIAEQAGAVVRQMDGTELVYNRENTLNEKGFFIVNRPENIWV